MIIRNPPYDLYHPLSFALMGGVGGVVVGGGGSTVALLNTRFQFILIYFFTADHINSGCFDKYFIFLFKLFQYFENKIVLGTRMKVKQLFGNM